MKSIIPGDRPGMCYICHTTSDIERHHIFGGSDRDASEAYGLTVHLCYQDHRGTRGVHGRDGKELMQYLHEIGQQACEKRWIELEGMAPGDARTRFIWEFRRSYV